MVRSDTGQAERGKLKSLILPVDLEASLKLHLFEGPAESCAVIFAASSLAGGDERLLARTFLIPSSENYIRRTEDSAVLSPKFVFEVTRQAQSLSEAIVFVHSHPFEHGNPVFSAVDDAGEREITTFVRGRGGLILLSLVGSRNAWRCRILGTEQMVPVIRVGPRTVYPFAKDSLLPNDNQYDRQIRAFGATGQSILGNLRVAIVGLGGTGSLVAQQLSYLGVRQFILIDPDKVEAHSLNRLVGATPQSVDKPKVEVIERYIRRVSPRSDITKIVGDITDEKTAPSVFNAHFIFCCTDSHASRAVLNQIAYQYLIPCIDMGVSLNVSGGTLTQVAGRVQTLAPGLACLTCTNSIDPRAVREELMTEEQRRVDPYFSGGPGIPQPSVVSLNSTISSLAVTMFIGAVTDAPLNSRFQLYDGILGTVRNVAANPDPKCIVCSNLGALARGDGMRLPVKHRVRNG